MVCIVREHTRFCFNKYSGAIENITFDSNHTLESGLSQTPFRIYIEDDVIETFETFNYVYKKNVLSLNWIRHQLNITARISLKKSEISFRFHIDNQTNKIVKAFEYPILAFKKIDERNYLASSYATGFLIENPIDHLENNDHLKFYPYPESFSGLSMQYIAYYGLKHGFYFACHDHEFHQKWINYYRHNNQLEISHMYGFESLHKNNTLHIDYDIILKPFTGNWMDASNYYKAWAIKQPFCPKKVIERPHATWLYQSVGLATFGISASQDRSLWFKRYHHDLQLPIYHILGPDWTKEPQTFRRQIPGELPEWVCTRYREQTKDLLRKQGDYISLFEFDFLVRPKTKHLTQMLQQFPKPTLSHDAYQFKMICPSHTDTLPFHVNRDKRLVEEQDVDALYYDISANNLIKICMDENHNHKVGGGAELTHAYRLIYQKTKEAIYQAKGDYVPIGTEMMNEVFLDTIDYYQARAWGQPASALEGWPFMKLIQQNKARFIPMFSYVYHEYGAVRVDGWGKLVKEIGELFYHTVAKTYLWGGIYEINHEYSPMEMIDQNEPSSDEHYVDYINRGYEYMQPRMDYIRQFAILRLGIGNRFLAYGKMIKPIDFKTKQVDLNWFHYNHNQQSPAYEQRGEIKVDAIISSAYEDADKNVAHFFANVTKQPQTLTLDTRYFKTYNAVKIYRDFHNINDYEKIKIDLYHHKRLNITIDAHKVIMVIGI